MCRTNQTEDEEGGLSIISITLSHSIANVLLSKSKMTASPMRYRVLLSPIISQELSKGGGDQHGTVIG